MNTFLLEPLYFLYNKKIFLFSILLVLIVFCGVSVNYISYENRRLHNELQQAQEVRNAKQVEWGRLLLEYGALAAPARIEKMASEKLNMVFPSGKQVKILTQ